MFWSLFIFRWLPIRETTPIVSDDEQATLSGTGGKDGKLR